MCATRPAVAAAWRAMLAMVAAGLLASSAAWAQPADAERAQRRLQQQMQALQQQLQAAQAAKSQADTEREELSKKLSAETRAAARARQALRQTEIARLALEQERNELQTRVAAAQTQAIEQKRSTDETLLIKDRDMVQRGRTHDTAVTGWRTRLQQQTELLTECTTKNQQLLALGAELTERYRGKSVSDVLKQREPALGWGQMKLYDEMQAWRDRRDAERFDPTQPTAPPAAAAAAPR